MLSQEEKQAIAAEILTRTGCPTNCGDRLEAYIAGVQTAVNMLAPRVSIDAASEIPRKVTVLENGD